MATSKPTCTRFWPADHRNGGRRGVHLVPPIDTRKGIDEPARQSTLGLRGNPDNALARQSRAWSDANEHPLYARNDGHPDRSRTVVVGFGMHLLFGWLFASIYALHFEALGFANGWLGIAMGAFQGTFVLTVLLPSLPPINSISASGRGSGNVLHVCIVSCAVVWCTLFEECRTRR